MYYMDMEYCPETLESRIHGAGQKAQDIELGSVFGGGTDQMQSESLALPTRTTQATTSDETNTPPPEFDWESVIDIIDDINRGLVYLHQNSTVHRDLKPKNGDTQSLLCFQVI